MDRTWIGHGSDMDRTKVCWKASSGGRIHDIQASCEAIAMIGSQLKEHGIVKEA